MPIKLQTQQEEITWASFLIKHRPARPPFLNELLLSDSYGFQFVQMTVYMHKKVKRQVSYQFICSEPLSNLILMLYGSNSEKQFVANCER